MAEMIQKCPLRNAAMVKEFLKTGTFQLVQCVSCRLIRVEAFSENDSSYENDEYFVEKNRYVECWDEFCCHFDTLLDKINLYKKCGMFLDVGCGVGCLASRALERGFISQGVEISKWAASFARDEKGLNVVTGSLAEAAHNSESFDVVVINHVLEHVPEPGALLH
jgi:2-polyprenyl-3-methyl-5-hydroxy-6-metoxy-1,4-benzoquinol methylase